MEWEGWPNARLSRFVDSRPHRWHLQDGGTGRTLLLLHGAGASTMSFRDLLPVLAQEFRVVAVDLPGHGFTRMGTRQRQSLDLMTADLAALLGREGIAPEVVVGHSAGAAVALRLARDMAGLRGVVGINAALSNFKGMAGWLFPAMAKMLALNPLTAHAFSRLSDSEAPIRALVRGTGSEIAAEGVALYRRLIADAAHVDGALAMIAQWRLDGLVASLPEITLPVLLIAAENDRAVPPEVSEEAAARLPNARLLRLPGLGHLAHEEAPERIAAEIRGFAETLGRPG